MNNDVAVEGSASGPSPAIVAATYPRFRWLVLAAACLCIFSAQIAYLEYAPLLGEVAKNLGINLGAAANLMTVSVLFGAIAMMAGGVLCDRYGIGPIIIAAAACCTIPATLTPWFGHTYPALLCIRVIQGLSLGCWVTLSVVANQWFPPGQRGLAIAIPNTFNGVASLIAVIGSPALFQVAKSWQRTMAWISVLGWVTLLFAIAVFWFSKSNVTPVDTGEIHATSSGSCNQAWKLPITWIGLLLTFVILWVADSIGGLTPSYLAVARPVGVGYGPMAAGQLMAVALVGVIIGPLLAGIFLDWGLKPRSVLLLGFAMSSAFFFIQYSFVHGNKLVLVACLTVICIAIAGALSTILVLGAATYERHIVGRVVGVWLGIGNIGGAAGLFVHAEVLKRSGYYIGVIDLITVAIVLGLVLALFAASSPATEG